MARKVPELTEAEWVIIQAVWDLEPCPAPTVQEALEDRTGWTYSTVKTLMDRMLKKGLLAAEKIRNLTLYRSAVSRAQAQRGEVLRTVKRAFQGALTPMVQFLIDEDQLSEKELREIEALIRTKRKREARER